VRRSAFLLHRYTCMSLPSPAPGHAAHATHASHTDLRALLRDTAPLAAETPIAEVAERMLDTRDASLLSLPIVADGRPIGSISRYELMRIYLTPYGRELFGRRPVASIANREALVLPLDMSLDEAARRIAERIASPITEDFILVDAQGRHAGTGVVLDVLRAMEARLAQRSTELEQAYSRVKSSQLQLMQSEKMASLGQMVAGLVHEINTPLGYVRNNVEMTRAALSDTAPLLRAFERMADGGALPDGDGGELAVLRSRVDSDFVEDTLGLLDDTLHGIGQITELIGHLRNFSRLDRAQTQQVELDGLIDAAVRILQHVMKKRGIEVRRHRGPVPPIECAPAQINQVLLNLIGNAAQAIEHDRGRISIRTQVLGRRAIVVIEDNGKGIAESDLERIFDPFFTTKPVGQGTGLGLAIAHQIVEQHGGIIRVASRPGVGTRFIVGLPLPASTSGERT